MELNERQSDLLLAAFSVAPRDGIAFQWGKVGATCGYDRDESEDLSRILEKSDYLRMDGDTATLTPEGREEARRIKRQTKTISLSDTEQNFLMQVAYRVGADTEYHIEGIAQMLGLSGEEWDALRTRFIDLGLLGMGSTFGHDYLTRNGLKAAEQLKRILDKREAEKGAATAAVQTEDNV